MENQDEIVSYTQLCEARFKVGDGIVYPVGRGDLIAPSETCTIVGDDFRARTFGKFEDDAISIAGVGAFAGVQDQSAQTAGQDVEHQMVAVYHDIVRRQSGWHLRRCDRAGGKNQSNKRLAPRPASSCPSPLNNFSVPFAPALLRGCGS